jgi:hypothetical protein
MTGDQNSSLRQWLKAEAAGNVGRAEVALRSVFRRLADPSPSPGFAEVLMARLLPISLREQIPVGWRLLLAASLVLVALSVAVLPLVVWPVADGIPFSSVIGLAASVVVAASQALAGWLSFWQSLAEANRVFLTLVSRPVVAAMMLAVMGLAAVAIRALSGLRASDRSVRND